MGPDPAVAAVRLAVRRALAGLPPGAMTLVACSGGADSLALAAALAFEAPRSGRPAGGVTVDHGLQDGSTEHAERVVRTMASLGLDPAGAVAVTVGSEGGPENAARVARYDALDRTARRLRAGAMFLGHTRDDQAETVLLGLARGSGARSLAGMPSSFVRSQPDRQSSERSKGQAGGAGSQADSGRAQGGPPPSQGDPAPSQGDRVPNRGESAPNQGDLARDQGDHERCEVRYERPLLELDRATTRRACEALGLEPWDDPHNDDPSYARVRVRCEALPALERTLGPGVAEALARTARLLRDDADALDALAAEALVRARDPQEDGLSVEVLEGLPRAVRTRVLRAAAIDEGSPAGTLAAVHVDDVDRLVTGWRGQRHVDLPGGIRAYRRYGRLLFGRG